MALVWITHDIGVVAEVADSVAVMYGGRIVERGPVHTIFEQPSHPYTRALVQSPRQSRAAAPKAAFDAIPGSPPVGEFPSRVPVSSALPGGAPAVFEPDAGDDHARTRAHGRLPPARGARDDHDHRGPTARTA